jgi:hypothetical protein
LNLSGVRQVTEVIDGRDERAKREVIVATLKLLLDCL